MNNRVYWWDGLASTFHGRLGEIRPGKNVWPHIPHEEVMAYGLVMEWQDIPSVIPSVFTPPSEAPSVEPTPPSVDSPTPARR